ncbi:MAG: shewanella-like protein phosphatase [Polyangiaceae bacterium]
MTSSESMLRAAVATTLVLAATTFACSRSKISESAPAPIGSTVVASPRSEPFDAGSLSVGGPAPARVVAIGDLHGDLEATRNVLLLAGAIDSKDAWVGGDLVVVQTGDEIDRADEDRKVLDLFERLKSDAERSGGRVIALLGNHEVMNATFDFRYVTPGAFAEFDGVTTTRPEVSSELAKMEKSQRGRGAAFGPGGPYATMLASRPVVARVGDTVFVHGGIVPRHVRYGLDRINAEAGAWFRGSGTPPPAPLVEETGPLWNRIYSAAPGKEECDVLAETLTMLNAKRMVVGHTVQKPRIAPTCDGKAWRIDVGMSRAYGGPIQALEIRGDEVRVLER